MASSVEQLEVHLIINILDFEKEAQTRQGSSLLTSNDYKDYGNKQLTSALNSFFDRQQSIVHKTSLS